MCQGRSHRLPLFCSFSGPVLVPRAALPPAPAVKTGAQATWAVQATGHGHQYRNLYWTLKGREA